ncbi:MAG TPA: VWA-like domain-containing protein [Ktedonobacterales bacterium]|nr:VWA-like domain-containing protein [Ktedonobacterales bacterium]
MQTEIDKLISASLLRLRMRSPFFATLALFARMIVTESLPTAATDGRDIFINPKFLTSLTPPQQDGLLLHEVLHAALLHVTRRSVREPLRWNIAADIVVNGMIAKETDFEVPPRAIRDAKLEHLSVEEVYDQIVVKKIKCYCLSDLPDDEDGASVYIDSDGSYVLVEADLMDAAQARQAGLEAHWRHAMEQAKIIARTTNKGNMPAGMDRELGALSPAQLDWRSYLWRFLVRTPTDFEGFDRRFFGRGLYLDALEGEKVHVYVAVDTSGSIDHELIRTLLSEVQGILRAYPHLKCQMYYADAAAYGPYDLDPDSIIPKPVGGGGTDFRPFFEAIAKDGNGLDMGETNIAIYLTDGYGTFPEAPPDMPVLWVLTSGGLDLDKVPFGETVRLLRD